MSPQAVEPMMAACMCRAGASPQFLSVVPRDSMADGECDLILADECEASVRDAAGWREWNYGGVTCEQYVEREQRFRATDCFVRGSRRCWLLVDDAVAFRAAGSPADLVLSSCETFHLPCTVIECASNGAVQTESRVAFGIGTVLVDAAHRGRGYSTLLLRKTLAWCAADPQAVAAVLFSDVSPTLYAKSGFHVSVPALDWVIPCGWATPKQCCATDPSLRVGPTVSVESIEGSQCGDGGRATHCEPPMHDFELPAVSLSIAAPVPSSRLLHSGVLAMARQHTTEHGMIAAAGGGASCATQYPPERSAGSGGAGTVSRADAVSDGTASGSTAAAGDDTASTAAALAGAAEAGRFRRTLLIDPTPEQLDWQLAQAECQWVCAKGGGPAAAAPPLRHKGAIVASTGATASWTYHWQADLNELAIQWIDCAPDDAASLAALLAAALGCAQDAGLHSVRMWDVSHLPFRAALQLLQRHRRAVVAAPTAEHAGADVLPRSGVVPHAVPHEAAHYAREASGSSGDARIPGAAVETPSLLAPSASLSSDAESEHTATPIRAPAATDVDSLLVPREGAVPMACSLRSGAPLDGWYGVQRGNWL